MIQAGLFDLFSAYARLDKCKDPLIINACVKQSAYSDIFKALMPRQNDTLRRAFRRYGTRLQHRHLRKTSAVYKTGSCRLILLFRLRLHRLRHKT